MHFVDAKGILTGSGGYYGMNIYRGCTHGCIYCDSRSRCYNFTHPFEDVEVKRNAPELLEKVLKSKRHKCMIGTGAMSDPYMHCEEELRLTRRCMEVILKCVRVGVKGVIDFGIGLTLREGDREYYYSALDRHFPQMKERYIRRYGNAYELPSPNAKKLSRIFHNICEDNNILSSPDACFRFMQELPDKYTQMSLFDI